MFSSRVSLLLVLAIISGCRSPDEPPKHQGILVSWLAAMDKSLPCVVVTPRDDVDRLLTIGKQDYGCEGRRKVIVHYASEPGLERILAALPANPAASEDDSEANPWHVIRLKSDGYEKFRLSVDEAQLLFKSIAEDSPQLRDEIEGRLIHHPATGADVPTP
jgi:hypothetical protein